MIFMEEQKEKSLTINDVAEILQVSRDTVRRLIREKEIETFQVGRQIRILPETLRAFQGKKRS